jgi:hypothetical protein
MDTAVAGAVFFGDAEWKALVVRVKQTRNLPARPSLPSPSRWRIQPLARRNSEFPREEHA